MNAVVKDEPSFEEAIKQHLVENRQQLVKQAVSSAMERMAESMKYTAMDQAHKQINEFFKNEVGPEVDKYLTSQREALIAAMIGTIKRVMEEGLKKQSEEWLKDMANPYTRAKTIAAMLGGKSI